MKGTLHKTLSSGGRVLIGEGKHQIELILKKTDGKNATLTIVADRSIPIKTPEAA